MTDLVIRVYDVRFGDAVLVTIPDTEAGSPVERSILFDFGNALGTAGGQDDMLEPVIDDIIARLDGRPLDLYVMTHEHLDHVQGLFHASENLHKTIRARQAWLTGSADPHYYDNHDRAKKRKIAALAAYRQTAARLAAAGSHPAFADVLLANNDTRTTAKCVAYLREQLTEPGNVHYVHREADLTALQPATSATISLWAPEEDTADYYGRFQPMVTGLRIGDTMDFDDLDGFALSEEAPRPPGGVDAGAFYNLLDTRHGTATTLLRIDQAWNNTSVVLLLEWNGWKLLFTGDAEKRSWRTMDKLGLVGPVHFLKVSHHGSHTGMPPAEILDKLLPVPAAPAGPGAPAPAGKPVAAISTFPKTYAGVPDDDTLTELRARTDLRSTRDLAPGELFVEVRFPSTGPTGPDPGRRKTARA